MRTYPGHTLLELTLVLVVTSLIALIVLPGLGRARRVLAVRAAQSELASAVATARSAAILNGGAALVIDAPAGVIAVERLDGTPIGQPRLLKQHFGVTLESSRGDRVALRFDALGIGSMANCVIRIRSAAVMATVTLSSYGRVRL